jgi:predicted DNA-binding antitoxin AbrB/MazE fold protein
VPITIEAIVENGLLKPIEPLPLAENEQARITIEPKDNWVRKSYGICGWKGNADELRRLALAPDLDLEDGP